MGNSYVRQSASEIVTGNIVEADPINAEFNALQSAFDASAGHTHDGTVGEGQKISLINSITGVLPVANGGYAGIHNITATTNPSVTDDSSQGYSIGSVWINTSTKVKYSCVDNTLGAAVWTTFQTIDAALTSISGLTTSANQMIYTTGSDTYATTSLTSYGRSLLDDTDATTARGTLGLGSIATQNSNSVTITGGTISGTSISGSTVAGTTGTFSSTITTGGNAVWHAGNLTPANYALLTGATFTGGISGTTLNLSGTLTGVIGNFSGAVSGTTGTFSGAVSGTTGTFSSTITTGGNAVWHTGNLTPGNYAPLSGATFTGNVVLNANPTVALGAVPKQYVDSVVQGVNLVINGDMRIAQNGTSFTSPSSNSYTLDQWLIQSSGTAVANVSQVSGPIGFQRSMRVTGAIGNTQAGIAHRFEAANVAHTVGAPVTIQAVILASSAQTFTWQLFHATVSDNFTSRTSIASGNWSVTTSATRFTATTGNLPVGAANGLELVIYANSGGAFTSGTFDITGVQLETGSVATAFEFKSITQSLLECQRYFRLTPLKMGVAVNTTLADFSYDFYPEMRIVPTFTQLASGINLRVAGSTTNIGVTAASLQTTTNSSVISLTRTSGTWTAGNVVDIMEANTFSFSARL